MGSKTFLECCKNIVTSNNNESYHHVLWSLAPKESFCSAKEVELAMNLSVCIFNSGFYWTYKELLTSCNLEVSSSSLKIFKRIDKNRIQKSNYQTSDVAKERRKETRREKNKNADAFQKDYRSGAFHEASSKKK